MIRQIKSTMGPLLKNSDASREAERLDSLLDHKTCHRNVVPPKRGQQLSVDRLSGSLCFRVIRGGEVGAGIRKVVNRNRDAPPLRENTV